MWQSTCASSVVTRPVKMYHTTASQMRTATNAPFTTGCRCCSQCRNEKDPCGICGAAAGTAALGCGVGVGGVELMIWFTFHFAYIASTWPVARASDARDRLN